MGYKKFFLIPLILFLLILVYVTFINSLTENVITVREESSTGKVSGGEAIGVGQAISIQIKRATKPYLFGMVKLPAYAQGIGNLVILHTVFFWSLVPLTVLLTSGFLIIERRGSQMKSAWSEKSKLGTWIRIGKAIGIGALFALVAFLISGDNSSLALGLLVAYLEFRFSKEKSI